MVFGLFGKKQSAIEVVAPVTGEVTPLTSVPDPVFSQKMLGDGFAVEPTGGRIVAPVAGEVVSLAPTGHAVGLRTREGVDVLIHVGIDTVRLGGIGFTPLVSEGARVTAGQALLDVDLDALRSKVPSLVTPVVFTNLDGRTWRLTGGGAVKAGESVGAVTGAGNR